MLLIKCIKFYIIRGCVSVFKEIFVLEFVISAQCLIVPGKCLCGTRVTLHRMAAQTRVCLLLISDLLCPLPFENLLHVLLGTQTSELLIQNEGKILSQLEHQWETQSQGLTWCKLGGYSLKSINSWALWARCGVGKSLAEPQRRGISLSKCQRDVNTKFTFEILRGIHVLQTYCPKAPSPSKLLQEN